MNQLARTLGFVLLVIAPVSAVGQSLRVESGEHANFTRLVVPWPNDRNWTASRDEKQVQLKLEGHQGGFDTSRVFEMVPRSRITALDRNDSTLTVSLDCDCDVAAFSNGKGFLVIDVADVGRTLTPPLELAEPVAEPSREVAARFVPAPVPMPWMAQQLRSRVPKKQKPPESDAETFAASVDPLAMDLPSPGQLQIMQELQQRLAEEIGSATTRGLLEAAREGLPIVPALEVAKPDNAVSDPGPQTDEPRHVTAAQNLRITTSRDIPQSRESQETLSISSGVTCPSAELVRVEEWAGEGNFATEVSRTRSTLYGEFDRLDQNAVLQLARIYLHFGFGAEASQLLSLYPEDGMEKSILLDIAEILERGHLRQPDALARFTECDSDIALWAVLSKKRIPDGSLVNEAAALRGLNKLPLHLRKFLAPALSERFLAFGNAKGAATAMRSIERTAEQIEPEGVLAQASLALQNGDEREAKKKLEEVVNDNSAPSPEALLALVNEQLAKDQPISHETALLVEAYSYELQDSELGPDLQKVHVLSLTRSGQFDKAFDALNTLPERAASSSSADLKGRLIAELTTSASDVVFLDHIFQQFDQSLDKLSPKTKMAVSARLLKLGFAGPAQRVLALLEDHPADPARQILAARIALKLNQPNQAVAVLIGIDGPEADRLRAEAALMSGSAGEAAALFAQADSPEAATRTAWLADDWAALTPEETPVFGQIASLSQRETDVTLDAEGMLTRTSAAVEESSSAREAINNLLNAPELQLLSDQSSDAEKP